MNSKRIIGILICIGGVVLIFVSSYIQKQVESGELEISSAESKVGQGRTLFGLNPYSKEIGNQVFFNSADKKIEAGKEKAAHYASLANQLWIGGIAAIVVGLGIVFIPFGRKKR